MDTDVKHEYENSMSAIACNGVDVEVLCMELNERRMIFDVDSIMCFTGVLKNVPRAFMSEYSIFEVLKGDGSCLPSENHSIIERYSQIFS